MVTADDEVMTRGSAAAYEVVNLAPFVTSFSARLMASWQLYSRHALWVVMQYNYIQPNLMNQVNVPTAPFTSPACDRPSLIGGQTEAFTLCSLQSYCGRKQRLQLVLLPASVFGKHTVHMNELITDHLSVRSFSSFCSLFRIITQNTELEQDHSWISVYNKLHVNSKRILQHKLHPVWFVLSGLL